MITPTTPLTTEGGIGSRTTVSSLEAIRGYDRPFARISWGSIIAGAVFALSTQIVFTLLGIAIGLATLDPTRGDLPPGSSIGIGAGIWVLISSLDSLILGGYIAGRLGGTFNGWIHGLITWATCTLLTLMFLTSAAGRLVGTASGLARYATQGAGQASQLQSQLPPALQQPLNQLQAQAQQGASQAATEAQRKAQEAQAAARQPGEQPIERQAKEAGKQAAQTGAAGSFGAVLALVLGALAAAFGGKSGQRHPIHEEREVVPEKTTVTPARS